MHPIYLAARTVLPLPPTRSVRALWIAGALAVTFFGATAAAAAESRGLFCATPSACEVQLYVENDILGGTDRYYTSGLKLGGGVGAAGTSSMVARPLERRAANQRGDKDGT